MNQRISLPGRWLRAIWLLLLIALPLLGYGLEYWNFQNGGNHGWQVELAQFFNPTRERNLPTYLQCMLLTAVAIGSWLQGEVRDNEDQESRFGYRALALFSGLLALDECAALHERLSTPLQKLLPAHPVFLFAWFPMGLLVAAAGMVFAWSALREMEGRTRLLVWSGWLIYFSSAIGMKVILGPVFHAYSNTSLFYLALCLLEEAGEWLGSGLVCWGVWEQLLGEKGLEVEWRD